MSEAIPTDIKAVKAELADLRKKIRYHNNRYYNEDNPEITDYEYDQLMLRLKKLEGAYPEDYGQKAEGSGKSEEKA